MVIAKSLWGSIHGDTAFMRRVNGWLTIFWVLMIPVSLITHWVNSVVYVSALSLWPLVFAQPESDHDEIAVLVVNDRARRVVIYTWNFHPDLIQAAHDLGVDGYLSKTLPARDLVAALEAVHAGETVVSAAPTRARAPSGLDWPGRTEHLTERESEILALITQGKSNAEITELTYLSPNTVKSYIRSTYRKIGVSSRSQAVLWGVRHGFVPDHNRLQAWRTPV